MLQQDPCYISHHTLSMSLLYIVKHTLDFQQITDDVRGCIQVWGNELDIH